MTFKTCSATSSPKNKTDVDYGSIPTSDTFKKATILDELDPLVQERIQAQQQKKRRVAAWATLLFIGVAAVITTGNQNPSLVLDDPKAMLDNRFASLLVDDQAFYFPLATSGSRRLGSLTSSQDPAGATVSNNPWTLAWADNKDSFAAVGAYYHAKGKAIAHYYKSLYNPKYNKTAQEAGVANVTLNETAPWTFDWKKDGPAAIAMSQRYKAIGDAIEDHYKQAFDPTTTTSSSPSSAASDASTRRYLKALKKESSDQDTVPAYDWAVDRDRGIAIGQHFQELGQQIKEHYQKAFGELAESDTAAPIDWSSTWIDLKAKGEAIGTYYHDKGIAIARFYEQQMGAGSNSAFLVSRKVSLWHTRSASLVAAVPASSDTDDATTTITAKNDWYIWGMDWQNEKEQAMNLHEEMKAKGQAIAAYYRAKFDPTYLANAAELVSNTLDGLSFPSWGEDAEADKAHGKAIGEYWAAHGKQVGKEQKDLWKDGGKKIEESTTSPATFWQQQQQQQGDSWKERGQNIGKFWQDFYRSRFDPTYDSKSDLD